MKYKIINLKADQPTVPQALALLEVEIEVSRREGIVVLKVIHGYGSHGVGGEIKRALKYWLDKAVRQKFIRDYIKGEQWTAIPKNEKFKKLCPEVLGDPELYYANAGVTLILI